MQNKVVVITGASRGIGLATANEFLKKGYRVVGTSTTGNSSTYKLDLSSEQSIESFVRQLNEENIRIDFLINNAAIMIDQKETSVDIKKLTQTLNVNLIGTISLTEKLLSIFNDGGAIVNLSSELGSLLQNMPNKSYAYRISKTAINMYTLTLSQRLEGKGIRVYSFAPGWVKTDMGTMNALREPHEPAREIVTLCESNNRSGLFYEKDSVRAW
jgi:NAD(P)-dependent dehydrogenase (short-subunit alcohol dehydrogenase family)